ncbi:phosphatidylinositol kinase- protein kinase tor1 [Tieghemiomyces parasiticus]|uniref:Serine/threonine-protein kinase TOR n=1 Tax=Tieghemiomyces parasiticus TaxID=78921 RepID=A0A9W8ACW1_9FUNG|nr:phosphatidylinositol kinase- protein kinase tor1 [Tieghemiomyces parasiticus]
MVAPAALPATHGINSFLLMLRSRDYAVRRKAMQELTVILEAWRTESYSSNARGLNEFKHQFSEMSNSTDPSVKLVGAAGLETVIPLFIDEDSTVLARYSHILLKLLQSDDIAVVRHAVRASVMLLQIAGSLTPSMLEATLTSAIEWLQGERLDTRRHAAVLLLREIATKMPNSVYSYVNQALQAMWGTLRDSKPSVRMDTSEALGALLDIVERRETPFRPTLLTGLYDEAQNGIKMQTLECLHSSLLVFQQLLKHSGMFMSAHYREVATLVYRVRDHRELLIRQAAIRLMEILAQYSPSDFRRPLDFSAAGGGGSLLPGTTGDEPAMQLFVTYLLGQLKKEKERPAAYRALGEIALQERNDFLPYVSPTVQQIKEFLAPKSKHRADPDTEEAIMQCISHFAQALGPAMAKYLHDSLDLLFVSGLTPNLQRALNQIALNVNQMLPAVQARLLDELSWLLAGQAYVAAGAPARLTTGAGMAGSATAHGPAAGGSAAVANGGHYPATGAARAHERPTEGRLILALETLGEFNFQPHNLTEFVCDHVLPYIESDSVDVQMAAITAVNAVFDKDKICQQTSQHAYQIVNEVLQVLLSVAVADSDALVRARALKDLTRNFDHQLAQSDNIRMFSLALNDETVEVKLLAVGILGRLVSRNPAQVLPFLRRALLQVLTELECAPHAKVREECCRSLDELARSAPQWIRAYIVPIYKSLFPRIKDPNPAVSVAALDALAAVARAGGEDLRNYLGQIMPVLTEILGDQIAPQRRVPALRVLTYLGTYAGVVITPYTEYPSLMNYLIAILKHEKGDELRQEALRALGTLGAIDPYQHHSTVQNHAVEAGRPATGPGSETDGASDEWLATSSLFTDDYDLTIVINALVKILADPSLAGHHSVVIQALMHLFTTLTHRCFRFLGKIVPAFTHEMKVCPTTVLDFYFEQLSILILICKQNIRPHLDDMFALFDLHWGLGPGIQVTITGMLEAISRALEGDFREYLPKVLPALMEAAESDTSERRPLTLKVMHAVATFGTNIEEYIHFVMPVFIRIIERADTPATIRRRALHTSCLVAETVNCRGFASRLVHCVTRLLAAPNQYDHDRDVTDAALDALCVMICQLQQDYLPFISVVDKVIQRHKIPAAKYNLHLGKLVNNEPLPRSVTIPNLDQLVHRRGSRTSLLESGAAAAAAAATSSGGKQPVNLAVLRDRCDVSPWSTREDWINWMRKFNLFLLEESPNAALRSCSTLATQYPPLARDLFNVGFMTMWLATGETDQGQLVTAMHTALRNPEAPNEIVQAVLNLAEFMEHDDKAIQIDIRSLAEYAMRSNAFAKALHFSELTFLMSSSAENLDRLIRAYTQLNQHDAATGLIKFATKLLPDLTLQNKWFERLERWGEALTFYEDQEAQRPDDMEVLLGKMRCLHHMCEWHKVTAQVEEVWDRVTEEYRPRVALLAAGAAWGSGELDKIDQYLRIIDKDSADQCFFRAVLAVNRQQDDARALIRETRRHIDRDMTGLDEGYGRSYGSVVRIQMLTELEEILEYRACEGQPKRQDEIRDTWDKRLQGVSREIDVWQKLLRVRATVLPPSEDMGVWLEFAELCRESGNLGFAENTIASILGVDPMHLNADMIYEAPCPVVYAYLEVLWARDEQRDVVYHFLDSYSKQLRYQYNREKRYEDLHLAAEEYLCNLPDNAADVEGILARFHLKKGEWYGELREERDRAYYDHVISCYSFATLMTPNWYNAWHAWAQANYEVVTAAEKDARAVTPDMLVTYIVPAVEGFAKSIALSSGSTLQDTLRFLALLFNYGYQAEVQTALAREVQNVPTETWLQVIPQLIARIHVPSTGVRHLIQQILAALGKVYPQALLFSLIVATKSESAPRRQLATETMNKLKLYSERLVTEAELVGRELIRTAVLWAELWQAAVEEASRQYLTYHNLNAMYEILRHHHQTLAAGPTTVKETQFVQQYGRDLAEAWNLVEQWRQTLDLNVLNQAWEIYSQLHKKFEKQPVKATTHSLDQMAPVLLSCQDMELMMPGLFQPGRPLVTIAKFDPTVYVYGTKQRPRRMAIYGSDGRKYQYLLKGHEDLRQDERVMQLFELVNNLLARDAETFKRHLDIERYPVVPLSPNTGLIGWVEDSDTLHALIKEFRDARDMALGIEHRYMQGMAPGYDHLPVLPKVEVFEAALNGTHGQDLYKVLWIKSKNSEVWLERRTCYTRSLAVMSIVGYVLGLGDRHPSNLMLHRVTGKIVHIDFGDCFEVAMNRDRFPETVPFRLTRMLIIAMEIAGIEGSFRVTCEHVMRVVRSNKDSMMAVLEAFVYDPLINWRLASNNNTRNAASATTGGADAATAGGSSSTTGGAGAAAGSRRSGAPQREDAIVDRDENYPTGNNEQINARALEVITRVSNKLTGRDFHPNEVLPVKQQVSNLIDQATSSENLCQLYVGWCSFW